jgi:hypothetical protein
MAFMLEVEFTGLCQYLVQRDGTQIGVVMPDARQNGRPVESFDFESSKKYLVPHVGYLRYNLADTGVAISSAGRQGTPSYEVIHRFDYDDLDFGFGFDQPMEQHELHLPNVREFASTVSTKPGLFSEAPPKDLLMRTIVRGGSLTTRPNGGLWRIDQTLSSNGNPPYLGQFAGFATWRRLVFDDEIVLRLRDWNGADKDVIRLRPHGRDRVVRLKIANLCAENPLEWPELYLRMFSGDADDDFRWFYRLWQDRRGDFKTLLGSSGRLPVPEPIQAHSDLTNCTGSQYLVESVEGS